MHSKHVEAPVSRQALQAPVKTRHQNVNNPIPVIMIIFGVPLFGTGHMYHHVPYSYTETVGSYSQIIAHTALELKQSYLYHLSAQFYQVIKNLQTETTIHMLH